MKKTVITVLLSSLLQHTFADVAGGEADLHNPGGWGGPKGPHRWGDNEWNWGHGPPKGDTKMDDHNQCPAELVNSAPRWQLPFQAMMPRHFPNGDTNQHWEHFCPRDRDAGVLYHPVPENRGCCTWRATATLANGNWACCPCGATCTGNVPPMAAEWTQGQPWGGNAPPVVTVTVTPTPGVQGPYVTSAPGGGIYTVYPTATQPPGPGYPPVVGGAPVPPPQNQGAPYQYVPGTTVAGGQTVPPSWAVVTGTHKIPVSVCQQGYNGKQSCSILRTTAVQCNVQNGQQKCKTSSGPVMQTVNAAPTGLAGRGMMGAAIAGLAAVGAVVI